MTLLTTIKSLLKANKHLRGDDKELMWEYWKIQGYVKNGYITHDNFMKAEIPENIRRCRQKIQETDPSLRPDSSVYKGRQEKAQEMKIRVAVFNDVDNTMRYEYR
jgi:hypothetical protein